MRLGNVRHHGFVIEAVGQCANHDGRTIAVVVGIAFDIAGETQRLQNAVRRRSRQTHCIGQRVDRRSFQTIEFRQHLESAIQGSDGTSGFAPGFIVGGVVMVRFY